MPKHPVYPCHALNCTRLQKYCSAGYCDEHYHLSSRFKHRTCTVTGCDREHTGYGYCEMHLRRWHRTGKVELQPRPSMSERFWSKVDKSPGLGPNGDCWMWTGYCDPMGYGRFTINRAQTGQRATHTIWLLLYGTLPTQHILHSCDNPTCVRPEHLREGTPADNALDKMLRNRHPTKYKPEQIVAVRLLRRHGLTHKAIAAETGVNENSVAQICAGRQWRRLDVESVY